MLGKFPYLFSPQAKRDQLFFFEAFSHFTPQPQIPPPTQSL